MTTIKYIYDLDCGLRYALHKLRINCSQLKRVYIQLSFHIAALCNVMFITGRETRIHLHACMLHKLFSLIGTLIAYNIRIYLNRFLLLRPSLHDLALLKFTPSDSLHGTCNSTEGPPHVYIQ